MANASYFSVCKLKEELQRIFLSLEKFTHRTSARRRLFMRHLVSFLKRLPESAEICFQNLYSIYKYKNLALFYVYITSDRMT
jgi:hypothetical protein